MLPPSLPPSLPSSLSHSLPPSRSVHCLHIAFAWDQAVGVEAAVAAHLPLLAAFLLLIFKASWIDGQNCVKGCAEASVWVPRGASLNDGVRNGTFSEALTRLESFATFPIRAEKACLKCHHCYIGDMIGGGGGGGAARCPFSLIIFGIPVIKGDRQFSRRRRCLVGEERCMCF